MKRYDQEPISQKWQLDYFAADALAGGLKEEYDIQAPSVQTQARKLSGGNLQKLILARELSSTPHLIVAMQPTRGLDIGAIEGVRQLLLRQRELGTAILLVSEDLDELLALSDRIAVLYEGHLVGLLCSADFDITKIGLMMTGTIPQDHPHDQEADKVSGVVSKEIPYDERLSPSGSSSFDEVLDHVRDYDASEEAPAGSFSPSAEQTEEAEETLNDRSSEEQDPHAGMSEKERILRKILGEKFDQRGEE